MGYDYLITSTLSSGQVKHASYQTMLTMLEMGDEIMHGAKLAEGGLPQVISFCQLVKKMVNGCEKMTISYSGEVVASV